MSSWLVEFTSQARHDLSKIDRTVKQRIFDKIDWLVGNFDIVNHLPLTGGFRDFYKLRVGDWRAVYSIDWQNRLIIVNYIDHRNRIYKRK